MPKRERRLGCGLVAAAIIASGGVSASAAHASDRATAKTYPLVLRDDDTAELLGNSAARELLTNVHSLLTAGRVNAVIRLIPKPYKKPERALLRQAKWRRHALLLLSTHLNADAPAVVYPGFVHRCAAHSDYSTYDVQDLRTLGRAVNHASPCRSVWRYHGPVLVVRYSKQTGLPYFRGLTFPNS